MGFITQSEYAKIYDSIKQNTTSSSTPSVLIFVALDVDAICACKMLTMMMKHDYIPFQIQPVAGYTDLFSANDRLVQNNYDLKTIVFLNLGALTSVLPIFYPPSSPDELHSEPRPDLKFYIIDSHRPWDLNNVFLKEGGVFCVDDGDIETGLAVEGGVGEDYAVLLEGDPSYQQDEDPQPFHNIDDDDEYDTTANTNGKRGRSRSRSRSNSASDDDALTENDTTDDEHDAPPSQSRQRRQTSTTPPIRLSSAPPVPSAPSKSQLQTRYTQAQERISTYQSQGTTQGQSISSTIYALLSSLGREDNDALWLGIVGWTSLVQRLSRQPLEHLVWRDEVRRLNPPPLRDTLLNSVSDTSIREVEDFPFTLLRHWSLYNAMLHSSYLCVRLRLYTSKGRSRLDNLLAKMGVSRDYAKQNWTHTPRDLKKSLKEKLAKVETGMGLQLVQGKAFERAWGYKGTWAATDVVQTIEATLVTEEEGSGKENILPKKDGKDDNPSQRFREREGEMKSEWVSRFWRALDAIEKVDLLASNLKATKHLHRTILATGQSIIEKRALKTLRSFRTTILREGPDLSLFEHPIALTKLAIWLCEVSAEEDRGRARRVQGGLVVAALIPARAVYLVVGVTPQETDDMSTPLETGNRFGLAFGRVAKREVRGLGMKIDAFEPGVVEVRESDLGRFLEVLSLEIPRH